MTSDVSHLNSVFPLLLESIFMSSSLAVILIDWNHSCLEASLLRMLQSYLPRWRIRNIRQDVYLCLFIAALAIMYSNSLENCRIAVAATVVQISFWLQSKSKAENVSDKCIGTPEVQLINKAVGGSQVTHKEQETSVSTCCRAGVPQYFLSMFPSSSGPQSEVNMEEELGMPYVEAFRKQVDEEEVSNEELMTAIEYLNTLKEGIEVYRSADKLINAVDHIQRMGQKSRLDDSGLPRDYSYEELRHIVVEESGYPLEDLERVLEKSSFPPSPEEFVEIHHDMKVQLEREVEEKDREMEETRQEMEETSQTLEETLRVVEETTQEVVESRQKVMSLRQRLQQNQQALQQKDRIIQQERQMLQQERQRVREMEQNPEGEWQRRLREMEEEIRRLSAQSDRSKCKICLVKEVQVSFTPCNHLISCQECVDNLKVCPMCRKPIQGTATVFFA
ncbi:golgin subfamily A member 6-like protein 6 isoform X2 [Ostrea edulis]|uniref:golgin subfamily A member 6-like protein 6 isoform X2 n=1 Tax=Ostrea edulis TaxID=37623 RepID=UPI0024AFABB4|nr:golgin subfamily A member 6-like protein 6 isoform X2 [Ostrea edulis]